MSSTAVKCGVNKTVLVCCEFNLLRPGEMQVMQDYYSNIYIIYNMLLYINIYINSYVYKTVLKFVGERWI